MASPFDSKYNDIRNKIIYYADQWGIPREIAIWQLWQENGYKTSGCSWAGACGIAQFMPATARQYGVNVYDIDSSLNGWGKYMSRLLDMFGGDIRLALAGYNGGEGRLQQRGNNISRMPAETRNYVAIITSRANQTSGNLVQETASVNPVGSYDPATGLYNAGDLATVNVNAGSDWQKYAIYAGIGLIAVILLTD